ncbi:HD domain-containing protein [Macrococcus lamae]|uniref:HD domain-containing protein n=1 Tax=Macrococcus lamae TaxID=198484 RepID=A0A4V3BEV9_9STAP|nr:HD domain-containing protein [Macrococcus lamae]TDM10497.1 HD domain-containing protein [Macrococcus lamae]
MERIIQATEMYVKNIHSQDSSGHDFSHIERVRAMAITIAKEEQADLFIVEMAALLHDTVDEKLVDTASAWQNLENFFDSVQLGAEQRETVKHILKYISFKGGANKGKLKSLEGRVVQDADRLDALGAIGIARTFMYAGAFGDVMYDPDIEPRNLAETNYRDKSTAINHFDEKLFKLEDLMNTKTGRRLAEERTQYMKEFVARFKHEWHGK